jgi:hypothetical protein
MARHPKLLAVVVVVVTVVVLVVVPWPVASLWRGSGINGVALAGPTCPVVEAGHPCPPGPVDAWLVLARRGWPGIYSISHTDRGRFWIAVPPGDYVLRAKLPAQRMRGSQLPTAPQPLLVRVRPHAFTTVTLGFDSGIR